jgi:hypothetical protein
MKDLYVEVDWTKTETSKKDLKPEQKLVYQPDMVYFGRFADGRLVPYHHPPSVPPFYEYKFREDENGTKYK